MRLPNLKHSITQILNQDWWVRIETKAPDCTYYFGPFDHEEEAKTSQIGYVDDLIWEGVEEITVDIEKISPQALTIYDHE